MIRSQIIGRKNMPERTIVLLETDTTTKTLTFLPDGHFRLAFNRKGNRFTKAEEIEGIELDRWMFQKIEREINGRM